MTEQGEEGSEQVVEVAGLNSEQAELGLTLKVVEEGSAQHLIEAKFILGQEAEESKSLEPVEEVSTKWKRHP